MSMRYPGGLVTATYNLLQVPGAPTIGTATGGNQSASVAFTAPSDIGGGAITSYTVISSGGQIGTGASSPVTVSGLTNGQSYTFRVYANNAYGPGDLSAASNSVSPSAGKTVQIKVWGAGGGMGSYPSSSGTEGENGGPGGYAEATFTINNGTVLSIFVGQGGGYYNSGGDPNGGIGGTGGGGGSYGGRGGGFTGVFVGSQTWANLQSASIASSNALIIAGSGGAGCYYEGGAGGGWGGGTTGGTGFNRISTGSGSDGGNGSGGTATAGGAAGVGSSGTGTAGSLYKGGATPSGGGGGPGGGGGAGWYGGGSAGTTGSSDAGGGGGGSGMIASITSGTSLPSGVSTVTGNQFVTQTGTGTTAPNNSDGDYVAGRGTGGVSVTSTAGGNGLIVVYIDGVKTSYSYTGNVQTVTV